MDFELEKLSEGRSCKWAPTYSLKELQNIARSYNVLGYSKMNKTDLCNILRELRASSSFLKERILPKKNSPKQVDFFKDLPRDVMWEIASKIPITELEAYCGLSKKHCKDICDNDDFWKFKVDKKYKNIKKDVSWKITYLGLKYGVHHAKKINNIILAEDWEIFTTLGESRFKPKSCLTYSSTISKTRSGRQRSGIEVYDPYRNVILSNGGTTLIVLGDTNRVQTDSVFTSSAYLLLTREVEEIVRRIKIENKLSAC